ncbi:acetate uptake transporter [Subtercola frigoramans]|uniref:Succinate-acetate transporter protein n=1 Tax=Subtercola frigoramans TaxID=120298 RepID=A0ABS2L2L8_9MICO|nr:acetate uptake transporter [Subtercola frigoramans]MBM7471307.1 succinate-acetate transporter protein [Subtercola frigoramans]
MSIAIEKPLITRAAESDAGMLPVLRPSAMGRPDIADPGALGLGAFALTTFMLSLANSGIIPTAGAAVLGIALFYGGIAQVAAGLWEFTKGNTFGATAFTSYGAFWLAFWWLDTNPEVAKSAGAAGVGAFLLAWTIFTVFMTVAAVKTSGLLLSVFVVLSLTFIALTIGKFTGITGITQLGGWLGLLTAALAWYGAFAVVINSTWKRVVLPVWPSK